MPSATTRVVTVRLPLAWYAEITAAIERASVTTSLAGDMPQDTGVSEWIRRAVREGLDKPARSAASRQRRVDEALADIPIIPYVAPMPRWGNHP